MRPRPAWMIALLLACSCGEGRSSAEASPSASAAAALAFGPRIAMSADGVFLDGARVADTPKEAARVEGLSDALRAQREAWRQDPQNLSRVFPGAVELELPADASCQSALALLSACSHAGFPNVLLTMGEVRSKLGVSEPDLFDPGGPTPRLSFRTDGLVELRKQTCFPPYAAVSPHDMVPRLRKLTGSSKLSTARIACEPGVGFAAVVAPFAEDAAGWPPGLTEPLLLSFDRPCVDASTLAPLDPATVKASITVEVLRDPKALGEKRIKAAIESLYPKLLGCYARRPPKTKPGLRTSLQLNLEIGDTGVVTLGYASNSLEPFPFDDVRKCIEREARSLKLDPPPSAFSDVELMLELHEL